MDGRLLPGARVRFADAAAVLAVAADHLPLPGGAVRKLDDPDGGAAGRPAGHPRRGAGQYHDGHGTRRVLPGGDVDHGGLTSKNAILNVEFAKANLESGKELVAANMQAGRDRLRPILITLLAFGLGVLPLAIATGAGSGAQRPIGTRG